MRRTDVFLCELHALKSTALPGICPNQIENLPIQVTYSNNIKFLFNLIYRSSSTNKDNNTKLLENIHDTYAYSITNQFTGVYFLGDFNYPKVNWNISHENNHEFYDAITNLGLLQIVNEPTRYKNIIDLVITDSPGYTNDITINPPIKNCDHNVILFDIMYNDKPIEILPRKIYKYQEANWTKINENLGKIYWLEKF